MPIILHGNARVIYSILISTASSIILLKFLFDNLFCNLPYNVTTWATCNDSSRKTSSLERHEPGSIFYFFIQNIDAKLKLKNKTLTIANDTSLVAKVVLSLPIHFLVQSVFLLTHGKYCMAFSILYYSSDVMIKWQGRKISWTLCAIGLKGDQFRHSSCLAHQTVRTMTMEVTSYARL